MGELKSLSKLAGTLIDAAEKNSEKSKLCSTNKLSKIDHEELRSFLSSLYRQNNSKAKIAASVINSIFHEGKSTFLFSKKILENVLMNDKNIKRNTVGSDYSTFYSYLIGNDILNGIVSGDKKAASVLELKKAELVSLFDKIFGPDHRQKQREKCLKIFKSYTNSIPSIVPNISSPDSNCDPESKVDIEIDTFLRQKSTSLLETPTPPKTTPTLPDRNLSFDSLAPADQLKALLQLDNLTDWEKSYLADLQKRFSKYGSFRPKQQKVLDNIWKIRSNGKTVSESNSSPKIYSPTFEECQDWLYKNSAIVSFKEKLELLFEYTDFDPHLEFGYELTGNIGGDMHDFVFRIIELVESSKNYYCSTTFFESVGNVFNNLFSKYDFKEIQREMNESHQKSLKTPDPIFQKIKLARHEKHKDDTYGYYWLLRCPL